MINFCLVMGAAYRHLYVYCTCVFLDQFGHEPVSMEIHGIFALISVNGDQQGRCGLPSVWNHKWQHVVFDTYTLEMASLLCSTRM